MNLIYSAGDMGLAICLTFVITVILTLIFRYTWISHSGRVQDILDNIHQLDDDEIDDLIFCLMAESQEREEREE